MHAADPRRCAHLRYRLPCAELDKLRTRASDRCELCGLAGPETPHGSLHIDHDARLGDWAVRGLLCSRCNTMLDSNVHVLDADAVERYLADPWYRTRGIDPAPPEPGVGTLVKLPNRIVAAHGVNGWEFHAGPRGYWVRVRPKTWDGFCRRYGPQNLVVLEQKASLR